MTKPASSGQTWAIKCSCGLDVRSLNLSYEDASGILDDLNSENRDTVIHILQTRGATGTPKEDAKAKARKYEAIYDVAQEAGRKAAEECTPTPMVVAQHVNPLDDDSDVVKSWYVPSGVCGFAGLTVTPGNSSFARWLKKNKGFYTHYRGGVQNSLHEYGQSMEKKQAHAGAMARVLNQELPEGACKRVYSWSRMD